MHVHLECRLEVVATTLHAAMGKSVLPLESKTYVGAASTVVDSDNAEMTCVNFILSNS